MSLFVSGEGYEYITESGSTRDTPVYVHRLVAVAEFGFEAVCDMDVHHKISVPWYNSGDNVEPMDPYEHRIGHLDGTHDESQAAD